MELSFAFSLDPETLQKKVFLHQEVLNADDSEKKRTIHSRKPPITQRGEQLQLLAMVEKAALTSGFVTVP